MKELTEPIRKDRDADEQIAEIVNKLEALQCGEFNKDNDRKMRGLIKKLLSEKYHERITTHASEIRDCIECVKKLYKEHNEQAPKNVYVLNSVLNQYAE